MKKKSINLFKTDYIHKKHITYPLRSLLLTIFRVF